MELDPARDGLELALAYATADNVAGRPVYRQDAPALLHADAAAALARARDAAARLGLRLRIWDALRPSEAQWTFWRACPNPDLFADPRVGSPHSRGVAVDLTLVDGADGRPLDMGTGFDDPDPAAWHGSDAVSPGAQRNRALLLGIMTAAGWDFYGKEWWHYQLFGARSYPLWSDSALPARMMADA